jgi:phosphoenolpyruvate phosphomutase
MIKKTTQFKRLLHSGKLEFLMEAHNGLTAKLVEEAGFEGIWASGLTLSASMGVRDSNEASWTQVLEVVELMSDASSIPILLDADTGYGNFNNVRRLVRKLEQRNIPAMCIEDKVFPKTNSFLNERHQLLADTEEFAGKIKAAKDTQQDSDFSVVARIEAFILGLGLNETLDRAHAYCAAGADAILVHSKLSSPDQILAFMSQWKEKCPVVIVPTTYYQTPPEVFDRAGVSIVIWANHLLRASTAAMQSVASIIYQTGSVAAVQEHIVSVKEIFRLQNAAELEAAELRYLPARPPVLAGPVPSNGKPAVSAYPVAADISPLNSSSL